MFATGHEDGSIVIWNISDPSRDNNYSSDLTYWKFLHKGHIYKVNELDWRPSEKYCIASVDDDAGLQIWRPGKNNFIKTIPEPEIIEIIDDSEDDIYN